MRCTVGNSEGINGATFSTVFMSSPNSKGRYDSVYLIGGKCHATNYNGTQCKVIHQVILNLQPSDRYLDDIGFITISENYGTIPLAIAKSNPGRVRETVRCANLIGNRLSDASVYSGALVYVMYVDAMLKDVFIKGNSFKIPLHNHLNSGSCDWDGVVMCGKNFENEEEQECLISNTDIAHLSSFECIGVTQGFTIKGKISFSRFFILHFIINY